MRQQPFASPGEALEHYGVKGMRWGVRKQEVEGGGHINISNKTNVAAISGRSQAMIAPGVFFLPLAAPAFLSPRFRAEVKAARAHNKLVQGDKKWKKAIDKSKKGVEVHNEASAEFNKKIGAFNNDKRWKDVDLTKDPAKQKAYDDAVTKELLNPAYARAAVKIYGSSSPSERYTFEINDASRGELKMTDALAERRKAQLAGVKHAADDEAPEEMSVTFTLLRNDRGHLIGMRPADEDLIADSVEHTIELGADFLEHYGVKGMRWGFRKQDDDGPAGVPKKTNKMAKADAEEFTKAKMFYGEGAGTRRKLIKAKVEERSKRDELYKKAFEHHVNKTDLAKRAEQATKTRKRTDRKKSIKKTGRGVGHIVRGNSQYANTTAAVGVAGYGLARQKGWDRKAANAGRQFINDHIRTR